LESTNGVHLDRAAIARRKKRNEEVGMERPAARPPATRRDAIRRATSRFSLFIQQRSEQCKSLKAPLPQALDRLESADAPRDLSKEEVDDHLGSHALSLGMNRGDIDAIFAILDMKERGKVATHDLVAALRPVMNFVQGHTRRDGTMESLPKIKSDEDIVRATTPMLETAYHKTNSPTKEEGYDAVITMKARETEGMGMVRLPATVAVDQKRVDAGRKRWFSTLQANSLQVKRRISEMFGHGRTHAERSRAAGPGVGFPPRVSLIRAAANHHSNSYAECKSAGEISCA